MLPDETTQENDVASLIKSAEQALRNGDKDAAASFAANAIEIDGEDVDALYMLAVVQRYLRQSHQAFKTLDRLIAVFPTFGRAYQEQGYNFKESGALPDAAMAFAKAVQHNPALISAWRELLALYKITNHDPGIRLAEAELARLVELPKELVTINSLIHEQKLFKAEQICRAYLKKHPQDVEAMRLLAILAVKLSVYDDAEFLLESCVVFDPENLRVRTDYIDILHKRQKFEKAFEEASFLKNKYPGNVAFEISYGNQNVALGRYEEALRVYDRVIETHPKLDAPHLSRGHVLKTIGRLDEGIGAYRAAYHARPDFGDAYWSLANLKTYRFEDHEIDQMKTKFEAVQTALIDRFHLAFALGKAYEDRADYAAAFQYYDQGNQLKKSQSRYKSSVIADAMQQQIEICDRAFFDKVRDWGASHSDPIFVVGLPRAGSTLLEQILASHSRVDGTMELPDIIAMAHRLNGRRIISDNPKYPGVLHRMQQADFEKFGDQYLDNTQCHRKSAPFFIDKMPNNFMHIGFIHAILPNAKIIDARRDPMACCFSGFKQLFADGQEFTYSLEDLGAYYRGYVELMAHWDAVLPGRVLRVQYEDVVADFEAQVRRILEYCDLPFERSCLQFYDTERSVRTPSSEQVRQPIYKTGIDQWRHFEPWLSPLKEALGPLLATD